MSWHIDAIVEPDDPFRWNVGLTFEDDSIAGRRHDRLRWADERHSRRHSDSSRSSSTYCNQINVGYFCGFYINYTANTNTRKCSRMYMPVCVCVCLFAVFLSNRQEQTIVYQVDLLIRLSKKDRDKMNIITHDIPATVAAARRLAMTKDAVQKREQQRGPAAEAVMM